MPTVVTPYIGQLKAIRGSLENQAYLIIRDLEQQILNRVRDDQLFNKGIDGTGKKIVPEYTPFTKALKRLKGEPTNRVTLLDTGSFYDNMYIVASNREFNILSSDQKYPDLIQKYGNNILKLTVNNNKQVNDIIFESLIDFIFSKIEI